MVGDEWSCTCSTWDALQNRSVNFNIATLIEKFAHGIEYLRTFNKDIFYTFVNNKIYVALAITHFRVGKSIKHNPVFNFYNRQRLK